MSIINKPTKTEKIPPTIWTGKDVFLVTSCVFVGGLILSVLMLALVGDNKMASNSARYITSLLTALFPLFWVKKKYGLHREVLGLHKGQLTLPIYINIGLLTAIVYYLSAKLTFLGYKYPNFNLKYSYLDLILAPISISGFLTIVSVPVSEEIMNRGFIYGYFRTKLGVLPGLILQALLFSFLHFNIYENSFMIVVNAVFSGLILGVLYETTGSLYPSMICHGMINYLAIIFRFFQI